MSLIPGQYTIKVLSTVNFRASYNTNSKILNKFQPNTEEIIEILTGLYYDDGKFKWLQGIYHGQTGWFASDFVELIDERFYDMLDYFIGKDPNTQVHKLNTGEQIQIQTDPANKHIFYIAKGHADTNVNYECLGYDDKWIYRFYDTSAFEGGVYSVNKFKGGKWCPRYMKPGQEHIFEMVLDRYTDSGEHVQKDVTFNHIIKLIAVHDEYTFPNGSKLNWVAEFQLLWMDRSIFEEAQMFAVGHGLVAFKGQDNNGNKVFTYFKELGDKSKVLLREEHSWLPKITIPNFDNDNSEEQPMPDDNRIISNPGFEGQPVKIENPRHNIYIAFPKGYNLGYKTYEAAPSIGNIPEGGWRFEPAYAKLHAWATVSNKTLKAGFYQVDFSMFQHNTRPNDAEFFSYGLYIETDKVLNHVEQIKGFPRFNLKDHGNGGYSFWFYLEKDVFVKQIGIILATNHAIESGGFSLMWFDVYPTVLEHVKKDKFFVLDGFSSEYKFDTIEPEPKPNLALNEQETKMLLHAIEYSKDPFNDTSYSWKMLLAKVWDYVERSGNS